MNILFVVSDPPWPPTTGMRIRNAAILAALADHGEVDLFSMVRQRSGPPEDPTGVVQRLQVAPRPERRRRRSAQARWIATSRLPWPVFDLDWDEARATFAAWSRPRYDLAWISQAGPFLGFRGQINAPLVVDINDLEDWKIGAKEASNGKRTRRASAIVELNRRRWRRFQLRMASSARVVTVCSEIDRARLAVSNASVVVNGYPLPDRPLGRVDVGEPPTLLLVGLFTYPPNIDAAFHLVDDILPDLRVLIPDIRVRLVGDHRGEIASLAGTPGVTVTGRVPEIADELARADAVAVPVRFGGGTRVKILEAFAHRIPVVSTPAGCEGLEVTAGEHLAVASTSKDFARACRDVLTDAGHRRRMVAAAEKLYHERYTPDMVAAAVGEIAARVANRDA